MVLISVSLGFPVPDAAGLLIPAIAARVQLKVVPVVPLVGVYEKRVLLQIEGGVIVLVSVGIGFITTTTLCDTVLHPFAVSIYTYVTLTGEDVVLNNTSPGSPVPEEAGLLIPGTAARVHAKFVPAVPLVGV